MTAIIGNVFTCVMCKRRFRKTRPEEEAVEELKRVFGPVPVERCNTVCDDCYRQVVGVPYG